MNDDTFIVRKIVVPPSEEYSPVYFAVTFIDVISDDINMPSRPLLLARDPVVFQFFEEGVSLAHCRRLPLALPPQKDDPYPLGRQRHRQWVGI